MTRIIGTLHEDQYTCMIISRSFLLKMRNISDKICKKKTNFISNNIFFSKIVPFMREYGKLSYSHTEHMREYYTCALHVGYLRLETNTQNTKYLLLSRSNNGCKTAPYCYVPVHCLPSLGVILWLLSLVFST
jgi:hypothetical protein